jgi:hypothetical protein
MMTWLLGFFICGQKSGLFRRLYRWLLVWTHRRIRVLSVLSRSRLQIARIKTKSKMGLLSVKDKLPTGLITGTNVNQVRFKAYRVRSTLNGLDRYNEACARPTAG